MQDDTSACFMRIFKLVLFILVYNYKSTFIYRYFVLPCLPACKSKTACSNANVITLDAFFIFKTIYADFVTAKLAKAI